jgi:hypothetical protein
VALHPTQEHKITGSNFARVYGSWGFVRTLSGCNLQLDLKIFFTDSEWQPSHWSPGIDFMKLDFGQKVFRQNFTLEFRQVFD